MQDPTARRHRIGAGGEVGGEPAQESGADPGVRVEHEDDIAPAAVGLGRRERGALAVLEMVALAPDHGRDAGDTDGASAAAMTASAVPSVERSSTTMSSNLGCPSGPR